MVAIGAVGALVISYLTFERRRWRRGWLSELIAGRLSTVSKQNALKRKAGPIGWRSRLAAIRLVAVEFWDGVLGYFQNKFLLDLRLPQIPSLASSLLIVVFIAAFFVVPHLPSIASLAGASFSDWWHWLTDDLELEDSKADSLIIGAFSGLVVVVIALIVFVAESIRDNDDDERKRVLVRISWLWPLGVSATIIPFGFLWSVARRFTVMLEVVIAVVTLVAFFRVVRSLLAGC
ncbi:MAG: hypothetical protein ACLQUZ_00490 [Rhizomicrobium sp.]